MGAIRAMRAGSPVIESGGVWWGLVVVLQWVLIVPHELGHALTARWFGFSRVRILVGSGRVVWTFKWLGFQWLINQLPFGGLTLSGRQGVNIRRWRRAC